MFIQCTWSSDMSIHKDECLEVSRCYTSPVTSFCSVHVCTRILQLFLFVQIFCEYMRRLLTNVFILNETWTCLHFSMKMSSFSIEMWTCLHFEMTHEHVFIFKWDVNTSSFFNQTWTHLHFSIRHEHIFILKWDVNMPSFWLFKCLHFYHINNHSLFCS